MASEPTPPSIHGVVVQICTKYLPTGSLKCTQIDSISKRCSRTFSLFVVLVTSFNDLMSFRQNYYIRNFHVPLSLKKYFAK